MSEPEFLNNDDVISSTDPWIMSNNTYLTEELLECSRQHLRINYNNCNKDWIVQQMDCRVLRASDAQGWRSGTMTVRVEVVIEFEPDELEEKDEETTELEASPLAALRD
jgi:hypothetical protein